MFSKKVNVVIGFAIVLGAVCFMGLMELRKYHLVGVGEKAAYINETIAPVYQWKLNKENLLIYYLPDTHATTVHKEHCRTINLLKDRFGIRLVGVEGWMEGQVTKKDIEEEFEEQKKAQVNGEASQLAKVNAEIFGGEAKKIHGLNDFLEVYPLYNFVENSQGIELFGVDPYTFFSPLLNAHERLSSALEENEYDFNKMQEGKKTVFSQYPKLAKDQKLNQLEQRATVEYENKKRTYAEALNKLENIIETKTPSSLKGIMAKYDHNALNVIRGQEAVAALSLEMAKRNIKQAVLVFGEGHYTEIVDECNKRDISFIIIQPRDEVRRADEARSKGILREIQKIPEEARIMVEKIFKEIRKAEEDIKKIESVQSSKLIIPDEIWREGLESQEAAKK